MFANNRSLPEEMYYIYIHCDEELLQRSLFPIKKMHDHALLKFPTMLTFLCGWVNCWITKYSDMSSEWVALILCGCYGLTAFLGAWLLTDNCLAINTN